MYNRKEYNKRYRESHREYFRQHSRRYRETHREHTKTYFSNWKTRNPDYFRQYYIRNKLQYQLRYQKQKNFFRQTCIDICNGISTRTLPKDLYNRFWNEMEERVKVRARKQVELELVRTEMREEHDPAAKALLHAQVRMLERKLAE